MNNRQVIVIDGIEYEYDHNTDKIIKIKNEKNKDILDNLNYPDQYYQDPYYPDPDIDLWESFLNRSLNEEEKELIINVIVEKNMNEQIYKLNKTLYNDTNCFIPKLTNNNGNCMFESLSILGLGDNDLGIKPEIILRNNISSILLSVRDMKDFFPGLNLSPQQIFDNSNEIEFIKNNKTGEVFEYNYDMMICDLRTNFSWTRLPAELILMTISRIYQVRFLIHHNKSKHINEINVWTNNIDIDVDIDIIHLGHINEEHYIPVIEIKSEIFDEETQKYIRNIVDSGNLEYCSSYNNYLKWANFITLTIYDSEANINSLISKPKIINHTKSTEPIEKINLDEFDFL